MLWGLSASLSHFRMAQNTMAVNKDDMLYTSASTALNQNESLQVYARAPTTPLPITAMILPMVSSSSPFRVASFRPICVMLQNRNRMVNELHKALNAFTAMGTLSGETKALAMRASIMNKGAPGGWPTSRRYAVAMNSPQSQKLAVGSMVSRYVAVATRKTSQPTMMLSFLKGMRSAVRGAVESDPSRLCRVVSASGGRI